MKHARKILFGLLLLTVLQFAGSGCVGYVDGGGGVVYGPDIWVHDDVWIDGADADGTATEAGTSIRAGAGIDGLPSGRRL